MQKLKEKARELKKNVVPIYFALLDRRTPWLAKGLAALTVAYLLSPIDLIPDFIPVLGWLDDLLLVPLLISLTVRLIPAELIAEFRAKTDLPQKLPKKWYYAIPIVVLYVVAVYWLTRRYLLPRIGQ